MHALPRPVFMQVLAVKYDGSGYGSFFHDPAWYSRRCSSTVLSHALYLYEQLKGTFDFEPVPFGKIASTQTISEPTLKTLLHMFSVGCTNCNRHQSRAIGYCNRCLFTFSYLQMLLDPESSMAFLVPSSPFFKGHFLLEACWTGRLDWVIVICS